MVGRTSTNLTPLTEKAPLPAEDGLYACDDKGFLLRDQFQSFNLDLKVPNSSDRENHKHPQVQLRAKYVPYEALRQQFWRQYLTDFDADGNGEFTDIELFAMLDSLGSTLSEETLHSFFSRFKKSQDRDGLTYDEVVSCLESELTRSDRQKMPAHSGSSTPPDVASLADNRGGIEFSGLHSTDPRNNQRLHPTSVPIQSGYQMKDEIVPSSSSSSSINDEGSVSAHVSSATPERVINIKECPLCHKPRLNKRSEVDIITHLAICASQDWSHMGSLMVSNYVTSEQAHRKWLRKAISRGR